MIPNLKILKEKNRQERKQKKYIKKNQNIILNMLSKSKVLNLSSG